MSSQLPSQPNRSLIDGVSVLQAVADAAEPMGSGSIARMLGLDPTRVNRLAKTLAALGFLRQTSGRKYTTGAAVHVLAAQILHASGLLQHALPLLQPLHDTGHVVSLGMLWRSHVCYLYHGSGRTPPTEAIGSTGYFPAGQSSIGRALLAELPDAEIAERVPEQWDAAFRNAIDQIRRQGWACVQQGPGTRSIAVPFGTPVHAAVALSGAIDEPATQALLPRLVETARKLEDGPAGPPSLTPSPSGR